MLVPWLVALAAADGPLTKVLELLGDLKKQVEQDGETEAQLFNEFSAWCDTESFGSKATIGDGKAKIADLDASIEEQGALQERLRAEIDEGIAEVTSNQNDLRSAEDIRKKEHANYMDAETQYTQSLDELTRAIEVLQNPSPSFVEASQSVQRALERALTVTPKQQASISEFFEQTAASPQPKQSFLQQVPFQSRTGELIQTIQQIKDETAGNRDNAMKEETASQHTFDLMKQSLDKEIATGEKAVNGKKMQVAKSEESVAASRAELDATNQVVSQTMKYLEEVEGTCRAKTLEWKTRTKLRTDEITAMSEAMQIIGGMPASQAPTFVQLRTAHRVGWSLLSLRSRTSRVTAQQLLAEARAAAAAGQPDPFKNVRKLINEMIRRLLEEAASEAEHKGWCDTEMTKSTTLRDQKSKEVRQLESRIEEGSARLAQLTDEIATLTKELAEAQQMDLEAQKVREGEKAHALSAVKEYEDAQSLIQNAVTVLQEFYSKDESLVQVAEVSQSASVAPPDTFDGPYEKRSDGAAGVIGILEISMSDYARLETEMKTAEAQAEQEFSKLQLESAARKATLSKDLEYKNAEKQRLEGEVQRAQADLQGFQAELTAVKQYIEKLTPSCTNTADSHEVRKERREQEIQSLQDALNILNNEAI